MDVSFNGKGKGPWAEDMRAQKGALNGCLNCQSPEDPRLRPDSTGVLSETERRLSPGLVDDQERQRVIAYLDGLHASLRSLREDQKFWLGLGPGVRVRYEDFQGDLVMIRAAYRK